MAAEWDTYAAALLVEAYMQLKKHPAMSGRVIAEDLSCQLRAYAWQKGEQPAPNYADVPSIEHELAAIERLEALGLQGEPEVARTLEDMTSLCKYHYDEFSAVLQAARQAIPLPSEARALLARRAGPRPAPAALPLPAGADVPLFTPQERGQALQLLALCLHWQEGKAIRSSLHEAEDILQRLSVLGTVQPRDFALLLKEAEQLLAGDLPPGAGGRDKLQPAPGVPKAARSSEPQAPPAPLQQREPEPRPTFRQPSPLPETPPLLRQQPRTEARQQPPMLQQQAALRLPQVPGGDYPAAIRTCLRRSGRVMTRTDIERELGPVPEEKIRETVAATPDLLAAGAGMYVAAAALPVDLPLLDGMTEILARTLAKIPSGKLSDESCRQLLVEHYPQLAAGTAGLPLAAFHSILGYLLGADFRFTAHAVCRMEAGEQ